MKFVTLFYVIFAYASFAQAANLESKYPKFYIQESIEVINEQVEYKGKTFTVVLLPSVEVTADSTPKCTTR
ncbi:hypothetical protein [Alteromonas halophila]|uniref:Uncharacterized protein n=1 Tax=Alteromonas halophila TaxID=516698 RepID=A0A918N0G6_9ALTE|nr:hypothetical protein [Alteromonas halophila]GGW98001.1 hypothetical protein GCM10007391_35010 [Alteromonas halophila]